MLQTVSITANAVQHVGRLQTCGNTGNGNKHVVQHFSDRMETMTVIGEKRVSETCCISRFSEFHLDENLPLVV